MNKEGDLFDERRKANRRLCKRRADELLTKKTDSKDDRRKDERRIVDMNKK